MTDDLFSKKNVVGVADAEGIRGSIEPHYPERISWSGQRETAVLVTQKEPLDSLDDADQIPAEFDGRPTDVVDVGGRIRPQPEPVKFWIGDDTYPERDAEWSELAAGVPVNGAGRGSIHSVFWSSDYDNPLLLSNRHVLCDYEQDGGPEVGDPVTHAGTKIAELVDWTEEVHPDDGVTPGDDAVAELTDDARERWQGGVLGFAELGDPLYEVSDEPGDRDTLWNSGFRSATTNSLVFSASSELTVPSAGRFTTTNDEGEEEPVDLRYENVTLNFAFTLGGDSGSPTGHLVNDGHTFRPARIHFAGSSIVSGSLPLKRVLDKYAFEGWYEGEAERPDGSAGDDSGDDQRSLRDRLGRWWRNLLGGTGGV